MSARSRLFTTPVELSKSPLIGGEFEAHPSVNIHHRSGIDIVMFALLELLCFKFTKSTQRNDVTTTRRGHNLFQDFAENPFYIFFSKPDWGFCAQTLNNIFL